MRPVSLAATSGGSRPDSRATTPAGPAARGRRRRNNGGGAFIADHLHAGDNKGCLPDKDRQFAEGPPTMSAMVGSSCRRIATPLLPAFRTLRNPSEIGAETFGSGPRVGGSNPLAPTTFDQQNRPSIDRYGRLRVFFIGRSARLIRESSNCSEILEIQHLWSAKTQSAQKQADYPRAP